MLDAIKHVIMPQIHNMSFSSTAHWCIMHATP